MYLYVGIWDSPRSRISPSPTYLYLPTNSIKLFLFFCLVYFRTLSCTLTPPLPPKNRLTDRQIFIASSSSRTRTHSLEVVRPFSLGICISSSLDERSFSLSSLYSTSTQTNTLYTLHNRTHQIEKQIINNAVNKHTHIIYVYIINTNKSRDNK